MRGALASLVRLREGGILLVAILLAIYFQIENSNFLLSGASLENLSQYVAPITIIACGEIMLLIGGEIDLSAGMVYAFAPFIMYFAVQAGLPLVVAILLGLAASALVGLINGFVTIILRVPSFVTTLGTLFLLNGFTLTISGGTPVNVEVSPFWATILGHGGYAEFIWAVAIVVVMHVVLRNTRWGLHTTASGANAVGASEAGILVRRLKIGNFILSASLAGLTGILESFRITSIDPTAGGTNIMFLAVASAVIGGTPLAGGSGTIIGALIGATVLGLLSDGFTLIGVNAFTFNLILGAAILLAMLFNIQVTRLRMRGTRG